MAKTLNLQPNQQLGKWKLIRPLGKGVEGTGGSGSVWEAYNPNDNTKGAIKFLHPNLYGGTKYLRFRHEIQALSNAQDITGVLPLLDHSIPAEPSLDDPPWLVTRLATPLPLALRPDSALRDVVAACASIARTMSALHQRGLSHRDIKPFNLFWESGNWYVGDFGLADFPGKDQITKKGEKVGPAYYIAPEMLLDSTNADGKAADVYSLAKTLWVLAVGQRYPPPGEHRLDVPALLISSYDNDPRVRRLDVVVEAATRYDPKVRMVMADFAKELDDWLNPTEPVQLSEDLSDLNVAIRALVGSSMGKNQRRQHLIHSAGRIIARLGPLVDAVNRKIESAGLHGTSTWNQVNATNATILHVGLPQERMNPNESIWSTGEAFTVEAGDPPTHFWCGAGLEISEAGIANVIVGFAMRGPGEAIARRLWCQNATFLIGGPSEENVIVELSSLLDQHVRISVLEFLKLLEGISVPPTSEIRGVG